MQFLLRIKWVLSTGLHMTCTVMLAYFSRCYYTKISKVFPTLLYLKNRSKWKKSKFPFLKARNILTFNFFPMPVSCDFWNFYFLMGQVSFRGRHTSSSLKQLFCYNVLDLNTYNSFIIITMLREKFYLISADNLLWNVL